MAELTARAVVKRQQILEAALTAFLENGYVGASMDQVAATASVSKQTVYKQFEDKEHLFHAIITDIGDRVDDPFGELGREVAESDDVEQAIRELAELFTSTVMAPRVQRIRRLIIAEAARFPDLGKAYWEGGFDRVLGTLAKCLARLTERGLLKVEDPMLAANHFAGLLLWIPSNKVMFYGRGDAVSAEELAASTEAGAAAFLAAYKA
ncbi:MAG: TetR/AcrR family transcriptional regulator, mexJK operon transcriptional repressor [Kribbellaceae bacterium]|jgi:AcrR family transcriptional regulator|nr:TetR/AcrR family transcriptional regulator, mexJK operon transcriptional repressor [Kribbellaceae bacterium]